MKARTLLLLLTLGMVPGRCAAQLAIAWFSVGFGGGTSSGGSFTLSATAGEPSSGNQSGGQFSFEGGFWTADSSPAPAAPRLGIFLTTTNTVVVSWPSPNPGWSLQKNDGLNPAQWADVLAPPTNDGTRFSMVFNISPGGLYLRLRR